jgi:hypothetical protein
VDEHAPKHNLLGLTQQEIDNTLLANFVAFQQHAIVHSMSHFHLQVSSTCIYKLWILSILEGCKARTFIKNIKKNNEAV